MSPLTLKIQEREKEFDEIHKNGDCCGCGEGDLGGFYPKKHSEIKSFHRATILAVLTELDRELEGEELTFVSDQFAWGDTDYHSNSVRFGHNSAITLVRAKLSEAIKELGG
jgi:hypothetical protein